MSPQWGGNRKHQKRLMVCDGTLIRAARDCKESWSVKSSGCDFSCSVSGRRKKDRPG
jgi:hypothetical protein